MFVLALCYAGVELVRWAGVLIGWWSGGPHWYAVVAMVGAAVGVVRLAGALNRLADQEPVAVYVGAGVLLVVCAMALAYRWSWLVAVAVLVPAFGAVILLTVWWIRRGREAEDRVVMDGAGSGEHELRGR